MFTKSLYVCCMCGCRCGMLWQIKKEPDSGGGTMVLQKDYCPMDWLRVATTHHFLSVLFLGHNMKMSNLRAHQCTPLQTSSAYHSPFSPSELLSHVKNASIPSGTQSSVQNIWSSKLNTIPSMHYVNPALLYVETPILHNVRYPPQESFPSAFSRVCDVFKQDHIRAEALSMQHTSFFWVPCTWKHPRRRFTMSHLLYFE